MTDYRSTMTKNIETYKYKDDYYIDIQPMQGYREAWIYNTNYGVKMLMFGSAAGDITKEKFENLVFDRAEEYIELYQETYED